MTRSPSYLQYVTIVVAAICPQLSDRQRRGKCLAIDHRGHASLLNPAMEEENGNEPSERENLAAGTSPAPEEDPPGDARSIIGLHSELYCANQRYCLDAWTVCSPSML